jgi:hypothetical protein
MTTVTETKTRTKAERVKASLEEKEARAEELTRLIAESFQGEDEARLAFYVAHPSGDAQDTRSAVIVEERCRHEAELDQLNRELRALRQAELVFAADVGRDARRAKSKRARELREAEAAVWREAGHLVERFIDLFDEMATVLEERDRMLDDASTDPAAAGDQEWLDSVRPASSPSPVDPSALIELVFQACVDPWGAGYRQTGATWDRTPLRGGRDLPELTPDLRNRWRTLPLGGHTHEKYGTAKAG